MTIYDRRLCYVEDQCACFTDNFEEQWGDDWNDAPYEHNAGWPYAATEDRDPRQGEGHITRVYFEGPFNEPHFDYNNSPYTVEQINQGEVPWLKASFFTSHDISIMAGTSVRDFIAAVYAAGGLVYMEIKRDDKEI